MKPTRDLILCAAILFILLKFSESSPSLADLEVKLKKIEIEKEFIFKTYLIQKPSHNSSASGSNIVKAHFHVMENFVNLHYKAVEIYNEISIKMILPVFWPAFVKKSRLRNSIEQVLKSNMSKFPHKVCLQICEENYGKYKNNREAGQEDIAVELEEAKMLSQYYKLLKQVFKRPSLLRGSLPIQKEHESNIMNNLEKYKNQLYYLATKSMLRRSHNSQMASSKNHGGNLFTKEICMQALMHASKPSKEEQKLCEFMTEMQEIIKMEINLTSANRNNGTFGKASVKKSKAKKGDDDKGTYFESHLNQISAFQLRILNISSGFFEKSTDFVNFKGCQDAINEEIWNMFLSVSNALESMVSLACPKPEKGINVSKEEHIEDPGAWPEDLVNFFSKLESNLENWIIQLETKRNSDEAHNTNLEHLDERADAKENDKIEEKIIDNIKKFSVNVKDVKGKLLDAECSICFDSLTGKERASLLKCSHYSQFHKKCIDEWLKKSSSCPMCSNVSQ